jgi:hypothetical protein
MSAPIYPFRRREDGIALNADTVMMLLNVIGIGLSIASAVVEVRYRRDYAARALLAAKTLEDLYAKAGTRLALVRGPPVPAAHEGDERGHQ